MNLDDPDTRDLVPNIIQMASSQGIPQAVMIRLMTCKNNPEASDRRKYESTDWFRILKETAIKYFGCCVLCSAGRTSDFENKMKRLVIHHRNYRHWFDESMATDVTVLCNPCHGRYHRGHRR